VRYLLDTHALIWALDSPERLPSAVHAIRAYPHLRTLWD